MPIIFMSDDLEDVLTLGNVIAVSVSQEEYDAIDNGAKPSLGFQFVILATMVISRTHNEDDGVDERLELLTSHGTQVLISCDPSE